MEFLVSSILTHSIQYPCDQESSIYLVSRIQYSIPSIQYSIPSIQHTISSIQYLYRIQYSVPSIQDQVSSIQYLIFNTQYPVSTLNHIYVSPPPCI